MTGSARVRRVPRQAPRSLSSESSQGPVGVRAECGVGGRVRGGGAERGQEAQFPDSAGKGARQQIAGPAEPRHQPDLVCLQVLEATPDQIGGLLAHARGEIPGLDERDASAVRSERQCRDHAVDAASHDEGVVVLTGETLEMSISGHGRRSRARSGRSADGEARVASRGDHVGQVRGGVGKRLLPVGFATRRSRVGRPRGLPPNRGRRGGRGRRFERRFPGGIRSCVGPDSCERPGRRRSWPR